MAQSLLAIATFITLIGGVIFGVSRFEKRSQKQETELVDQKVEETAQPTQPISQPLITSPTVVEEATASEVIADPWQTEEPITEESITEEPSITDATQTTLDLGDIPQAAEVGELVDPGTFPVENTVDQLTLSLTETVEAEPERIEAANSVEPRSQAELVTIAPAIQDPKRPITESSEFIEPRLQVETFIIAPTIQDPKRPNSDELDNLTQDILTWGQSRDLKYAAKLKQCATHRDPIIRGQAAAALGEIAARRPIDRTVESIIPILGKLTQDSNPQVRQSAVKSLGEIRSPQVLPYLEQALRSSSSGVKKAAQVALSQLKLGYAQPNTLVTVVHRVKPKR